jgi:Tfp pilus assembly protein PilF
MRHLKSLAFASFLVAAACGGSDGEGAKSAADAPQKSKGRYVVDEAAKREHKAALDEFVKYDEKFDWTEARCKSVAKQFIAASERQDSATGKPLPTALYNAGVTYMRCGMEVEALEQYQAASNADPNFHRGRAQMALFDFQRTNDLDGAVSNLEGIIRDARFQNVEALVSVAALQMERNNEVSTEDGPTDLERAKKNIQRALAIDDNYMPAFNQLAIYYMELAKAKAGRSGRRGGLVVAGSKKKAVSQQQLELAALVASQAIQKNANYAPIHNTAGLIQVQMDNYNGAVKSFAKARALDPKFFEAHMNYAAVNLSFRGFAEAEKAYKDALKLSPQDYEAQLGLALSYRGQVDDSNFDKYVELAQKHLDECKKIDSGRAEAYYNEAILTQEFRAKSTGDPKKSIPTLRQAIEKYEAFISKAGGDDVFAEAVKRSQDRVQDIKDTITFIEEGENARIEQEKMDKQMKEEEEARKKEEERLRKEEEAAKKAEGEKAKKDKEDAAKAQKAEAEKAAKEKEAAAKAKAGEKSPAAPAAGKDAKKEVAAPKPAVKKADAKAPAAKKPAPKK